LGGGFGSHEFYAFDADTGEPLWTYHTADDGPTAAVVADGKIAFNTESCELEIITTQGRPVWKKWLGDPLMSMPAVADGIVYMAYPDSRGDRKYYLAAFDLNTGKLQWKHPLGNEIITAPVVDGSDLFIATVDGSVMALDRKTGNALWQENRNATSAPAVWNRQVYFSRRQSVKADSKERPSLQQTELVAARAVSPVGEVKDYSRTQRDADYLDYRKRAGTTAETVSQSLDAMVGFAANKGSAQMVTVMANIGQGSVHGIWAYQGSKTFIAYGKLYGSMGDQTQSVDPISGKVLWSRVLNGSRKTGTMEGVLTPPTIVNHKVFVGNHTGDLCVLSAATGNILWSTHLGEPISFPPAVVRGRVYVVTDRGSLYCLRTEDPADDGWLMWGGSAGHNGPSASRANRNAP
jgi:Ca-activated chloride channel family protein